MSETKGWPTYKITVPDYDFVVEIREPSVAELRDMRAVKEDDDSSVAKAWEVFSRLIKSWNVTDCEGNPLPICAESFEKLPPTVTAIITAGPQKSADPKADSAS